MLLFGLASPAQTQWKAVEREKRYPISGRSGAELYASIGVSGPKASIGRAIALTDFKLTWKRDYQVRDRACVLASAEPKLTITTVLPEPTDPLPEGTRRLWDNFIAGVRRHEKVHARAIIELVGRIEAATVGLTVTDDPNCRKIRKEMTGRLSALSLQQRRESRDFDRSEMSPGGTIHQLVLALVNGD